MALRARDDADHAVLRREAERRAQRPGRAAAARSARGRRRRAPPARAARGAAARSAPRCAARRRAGRRWRARTASDSTAAPRSARRCDATAPAASRRCAGARRSRAPRARGRACARCGRRRSGARRAGPQPARVVAIAPPDRAAARGRARAAARRPPPAPAAAASRAGRPDPRDSQLRGAPRARCASRSCSIGAAGPVHFQSLVTWRILTRSPVGSRARAALQLPQLGVLEQHVEGGDRGDHEARHAVEEARLEQIGAQEPRRRTQARDPTPERGAPGDAARAPPTRLYSWTRAS